MSYVCCYGITYLILPCRRVWLCVRRVSAPAPVRSLRVVSGHVSHTFCAVLVVVHCKVQAYGFENVFYFVFTMVLSVSCFYYLHTRVNETRSLLRLLSSRVLKVQKKKIYHFICVRMKPCRAQRTPEHIKTWKQ